MSRPISVGGETVFTRRALRPCALVPPPRVHTIRYYGVFAGRHHLRSRILPDPALANHGLPAPPRQLDLFGARPLADTDAAAASTPGHGTALPSFSRGFLLRARASTGELMQSTELLLDGQDGLEVRGIDLVSEAPVVVGSTWAHDMGTDAFVTLLVP